MTNKIQLVREMIEFIRENNIEYTCDLIDYARKNRFDDWFKLLVDNNDAVETIDAYVQSIRRKNSKD